MRLSGNTTARWGQRVLLLFLFILSVSVSAGDRPKSITVLYEDSDYFPWSRADGKGINVELMKAVGKKLGVLVKLKSLPWKRCLATIKVNQADAVMNASFKQERAAIAHYPTIDGKNPDPSKRLHTDGYSLYRRKGERVNWNGKTVVFLNGKVAAQTSYSVVDTLRAAGVAVDDESKHVGIILKKLLGGRVDAAALPTFSADRLLKKDKALGAKVERCPKVISSKPYYLLLSKKLMQEHPDFCKEIWTVIESIRQSDDYERIVTGVAKNE